MNAFNVKHFHTSMICLSRKSLSDKSWCYFLTTSSGTTVNNSTALTETMEICQCKKLTWKELCCDEQEFPEDQNRRSEIRHLFISYERKIIETIPFPHHCCPVLTVLSQQNSWDLHMDHLEVPWNFQSRINKKIIPGMNWINGCLKSVHF